MPLRTGPLLRGAAIAIGLTGLAIAIRLALAPVLPRFGLPFLIFFPAILMSALFGGLFAGLLASALSTAAAAWFFIAPAGSLVPQDRADAVALGLFLLISGMDCAVIHAMHRAIRRAGAEQARGAALAAELRQVLEATSDGVFALAADWRITWMNGRAMAELAGGRDLTGRAMWEAFPEAVGGPFWEAYHTAMRDRRNVRVESFYAPLGRRYASDVHPKEGGGIVVFYRDVTERHAAAERLAASEARLARALAVAPLPIFIHAEDGEMLQVSAAAQEISGWRFPEDFRTAEGWARLAYADRQPAMRQVIDRLFELEHRVEEGEFAIRTRAGEERIWTFATAPMGRDARGRRLVVSMASDVTELRRTEAALAAALAEQRAIYANAPVGLAAHGPDLRFRAMNERLAALNGVPAAAHIGRTPAEVVPHVAPLIEPLLRRVLETGEPVAELEIEAETAAHPGERRHYLASYYPTRADGQVTGVSIAVLDIDARKRAEAALRDLAATLEQRVAERTARLAEANRELESFTSSVAHDLRSPLRTMQGFAAALAEDYGEALDGAGRDYLDRIARGAARLDELIGDLLAYSRLSRQQVSPRPVALGKVVEEAIGQLGAEIAARGARVGVDGALPEVMGHPAVLAQAVLNLVANALKFVAPGVAPVVTLRAEPRGGRVRLVVEDNGIGIRPEHRARIFEVFQRLHANEDYPGTGIGLALVRRGMERLGGAAGVESGPGGGSRFWIELPAARHAREAA